jgi:hypothetical protein
LRPDRVQVRTETPSTVRPFFCFIRSILRH